MPRRATIGGAAVIGAWLAAAAWAADPQSYKVRLEGAVSGEIETTLAATSDLVGLRKTAPVSPFGLILRARGDTVRLKTVLDNFGYWDCAVTATVDGEPLTSADLADKLEALPKGKDASVVVTFQPGPQYRLGTITVDGDLPEALRSTLNLHAGQPAVSADVLAAQNRLLSALQERGYAFAKVDAPQGELLPDSQEMEVTFHVQAGAIVRLGIISVSGLQRTQLSTVLSRLQVHTGDQYSAQALDRARRNLLAMGVFGTVDVQLGTQADANGAIPVTFRVNERKRHAVTLGGAYSSDLGGSGTVTWSDRNLLGHAEQLDLTASIINLNGSATNGTGYDTGAKLTLPEFLHPAQSLQISLDAIKQSLVAYDQTAETAGLTLTRTLSRVWSASVGFTTTQETITQPEEEPFFNRETFYYTLFAFPLSLRYDSTDLSSPLLDPTHGLRAAVTIAPTESLGPPDATYVISQIRASAYVDLHDLIGTPSGRSIVAVRGLYGYAQGASAIDLPPDQRFYAGGSGTIRGYQFQSVGPQFKDDTPVGGVAVDAFSVELRQRVGRYWGYGVFADAGRIGQTAMPFSGEYRIGLGAGPRYYTSIGALRVDLAVPVDHEPSGDCGRLGCFEIYIGLGQAF